MASEQTPKPWPPVVLWAVRIAIAALALYGLWDFLNWLPSLKTPDWGLGTFYGIQNFVFIYVINPLCALSGLVLAVLGRRLKLAALLAAVPVLHFWLSVLAFGIGIMIYGF